MLCVFWAMKSTILGLQNIPLIAHRNNKCTYYSGWKTSCDHFASDLSLNGKIIIKLTSTNRCIRLSNGPVVAVCHGDKYLGSKKFLNQLNKYQLSWEGRSNSFTYLWFNDAQHWMVGWFENNKMRRTLKKATAAYSDILPRTSLYETDKSHDGSRQKKWCSNQGSNQVHLD
jgi:hypothetical protein